MRASSRDYSQSNLLRQLNNYLIIIHQRNAYDKQSYNEHIISQILKKGCCFGLSFLYAVCMHLEEKNLFVTMINQILDWDGSEGTLNLTGSYADNPLPLFVYFELLASNVFSLQEPSILQFGQEQGDSLKNRDLFSIIASNNELKHVRQASSNAGFLTASQFAEILLKNIGNINNYFTLIHGGGHCSVIRLVNNYWVYYDPNDSNYEKQYNIDNSLSLAKTILQAHFFEHDAGAIGLTCASLEQQPITVYGFDSIALEQRLAHFGLHLLIRLNPNELEQILLPHNKIDQSICKVLVNELARVDEDGWSGFYTLVKYMPSVMEHLLNYLEVYHQHKKEQFILNAKVNKYERGITHESKFEQMHNVSKVGMLAFLKDILTECKQVKQKLKLLESCGINVAPMIYDLLFKRSQPNKMLMYILYRKRSVLSELIQHMAVCKRTMLRLKQLIKTNACYKNLFNSCLQPEFIFLNNYEFWLTTAKRYQYNDIKTYSEILVVYLNNKKLLRYKKEVIKEMLLYFAKQSSKNDIKSILHQKNLMVSIKNDCYLFASFKFIMQICNCSKKLKLVNRVDPEF